MFLLTLSISRSLSLSPIFMLLSFFTRPRRAAGYHFYPIYSYGITDSRFFERRLCSREIRKIARTRGNLSKYHLFGNGKKYKVVIDPKIS